MRPARFTLHRPGTLQDALALKARYGDSAAFYAGGTELLIALKSRVLHFDHLIDLKPLGELRTIHERSDGTLSIGALCTHRAIASHPLMTQHLPGYVELSQNVANVRVRAAGTLGGVLCFGEPHADPPTMLSALDAWMVLQGPGGERLVPARDFHLGEFQTDRAEDEVLVSIDIAPQSPGTRSAYRCFGSTERPAVGVAAVWSVDNPVRLSLWAGALTPRPICLARTEFAASQLAPDLPRDEVWEALRPVLAAEAAEIEARDDLHGGADYKRHLVSVLAQRALEACLP